MGCQDNAGDRSCYLALLSLLALNDPQVLRLLARWRCATVGPGRGISERHLQARASLLEGVPAWAFGSAQGPLHRSGDSGAARVVAPSKLDRDLLLAWLPHAPPHATQHLRRGYGACNSESSAASVALPVARGDPTPDPLAPRGPGPAPGRRVGTDCGALQVHVH